MAKVFIDTNILVYSLDQADPTKQKTARSILRSLQNDDGDVGVISTQVLQEFYVVCTAKLKVDPLLAKAIVRSLTGFETVDITPQLILDGIDCSILYQLSFWDSLIVATAAAAQCDRILTEDLSHGQVICGVRIENPFVQSNPA
jgi:predicted nucleic acid-binding protein